jgi:hypothetical protein
MSRSASSIVMGRIHGNQVSCRSTFDTSQAFHPVLVL